jgi:SAM-dependent methyltransferase
MTKRELFYQKGVLAQIKDKNASILVCGGGLLDKTIFENLGFMNVTISNLDTRMNGDEYYPFKWKFEDAESLSFLPDSFDYVVIHAAIHHTSSPHKVITEMYRVARKGVLAFESRDSLIMRFAERLGVIQTYEYSAVYNSECKYGGMNNTEIPNYVYRWTEREIEKTIQSYSPYCKHKFIYRHGISFPTTTLSLEKKGQLKKNLLVICRPLFCVFFEIFPSQQNLFSFYVEKPTIIKSLLPWLIFDIKENKITFNKKWGDRKYKNKTY